MTDQLPDPGVPALLRRLSDFTGGESVYLWFTPPPARDEIRWRVWTGVPTGTGGGEWGHGETPYDALRSAFEHVVRSTFEGRIGVPADGSAAVLALLEAAREAVDAFGRGDDDRRSAGAYRLLDAAVRSFAEPARPA